MSKRAFSSGATLQDREFSVEELCLATVAAAIDKKAFKPVVIDLQPQGAFTDYFVILSATNTRQVAAIADSLKQFFKRSFRWKPVSCDGLETCSWVLLDYGAFFIHIFQDSTRDLYRLEELWSKGRFVEVKEEPATNIYKEILALTEKED